MKDLSNQDLLAIVKGLYLLEDFYRDKCEITNFWQLYFIKNNICQAKKLQKTFMKEVKERISEEEER